MLSLVESSIPRESFNTWIKPMRLLGVGDSVVTVQVPSQFYYDWIEEHYSAQISQALSQVFGGKFRLKYTFMESDARSVLKGNSARSYVSPGPGKVSQPQTQLNPRYTFENFIEGEGNSFARAAALAVAESPGHNKFNPLVVYGGVGLGKTHLLQAIGIFALKHKHAKKAMYVSSEKFTTDFINSVKENKSTDFSKIYRSVDMLLVDDVQFFQGKEKTLEEFFHTFNALFLSGKQIVLSLDRPPTDLKYMESRLISRFTAGLVTDIQPPDFETRLAILKKRTEDDGIYINDDVLEYIAHSITSNVRELEGCLIRLMAHTSITGQEITLPLAKRLLKDIVRIKPRVISVDVIQETTAAAFGVSSHEIRSSSRLKSIARARQTAMFLCSELTNHTLKSIGSHFGNRDHSTVIHANNVVKALLQNDPEFREKLENIRHKIENSIS